MLVRNDDKLYHTDSSSNILEHYGVKGMKWGQRKSYDRIGFTSRGIERNYNKRNSEKRKNYDNIRRLKGVKGSRDKINDLRARNDELTDLNRRAMEKIGGAKRRERIAKGALSLAGSVAIGYVSTPEGYAKTTGLARKAAKVAKSAMSYYRPVRF